MGCAPSTTNVIVYTDVFACLNSGDGGDVKPGAPSEPNEYNFNYKKRGLFLLINNRNFRDIGLPPRDGSDLDAERLEESFQDLGFEVRRYNDVTCAKMTSLLRDVAAIDHSEHDCFGCAVLTHGDEGVVFAKDGQVSLDLLVLPFKGDNCPTLKGKPKLFFIQACQTMRTGSSLGHHPHRRLSQQHSPSHHSHTPVRRSPASSTEHLPSYHTHPNSRRSPVTPAEESTQPTESSQSVVHMRKIPVEPDTLFCYSTVPGHFSWRNNQDGSWFIQALCIVLENYGQRMELAQMLTHVNRIVAYEFAACNDKEFTDAVRCMPCVLTMLTRYVHFRPKKQDIR